jgi:hypothetical protein
MYKEVCFKLLAHSSETHTPQDMPPEVSSQSPSPELTMGGAPYYKSHDCMELYSTSGNWCKQ